MLYEPPEHIKYSRETGFTGITDKDKEQWIRKHPHIQDFELSVEEGKAWVSEHWNLAMRAMQVPRVVLDQWLGSEWLKLNADGYEEPKTIYNPEQLSNFVEQYFKSAELIKGITRGKRDGHSDFLATEHYDKALGHAVKLRKEIPDFPLTPEATGKPHLDLRRLQEWCIECERIANDLFTRVAVDRLEKALSLLRELGELRKSGFPLIDEAKWDRIYDKVRGELDTLVKVIDELGEPNWYWRDRAILGQDCEPLLNKLAEDKIHVPDDKEELGEMITAAEWMAKIDWDRVKTVVEEQKSGKARGTLSDRISASSVLVDARMAEEKINSLVWKTYCRENQDYAETVSQTQSRRAGLFNEAVDGLNSDQNLWKVAHLREGKLVSAFKRLEDHLFGTATLKSADDDPLREIIEELEAIRERAAAPAARDPIELMEQVAQKLHDWAKLPLERAMTWFVRGYVVNLPALEELDTVGTYLEYHEPELARSVAVERDKLKQLAVKANQAQEGMLQGAALLTTQKQAERLAKKLREIRQLLRTHPEPAEVSKPRLARIFDHARRLIESQFAERRTILPEEINSILRKMELAGHGGGASVTWKLVHAACRQEIQAKAEIVWQCLQKVHSALGAPLTETLATDLKKETHRYIEEIVKNVCDLVARRLRFMHQFTHLMDLESTEGEVKKKLDAEIDLYVDSLICGASVEQRGSSIAAGESKQKIKPDEVKNGQDNLTDEDGNSGLTKANIQTWEELSIDFIDDETLRFKGGNGRWVRANYAELGFLDRRKGSPNKLWGELRTLAQYCNGGYVDTKTPRNIQKDLDRICQTLKNFFGPTERPIIYIKKDKRWQVKFDLSWKRDSGN